MVVNDLCIRKMNIHKSAFDCRTTIRSEHARKLMVQKKCINKVAEENCGSPKYESVIPHSAIRNSEINGQERTCKRSMVWEKNDGNGIVELMFEALLINLENPQLTICIWSKDQLWGKRPQEINGAKSILWKGSCGRNFWEKSKQKSVICNWSQIIGQGRVRKNSIVQKGYCRKLRKLQRDDYKGKDMLDQQAGKSLQWINGSGWLRKGSIT